MLPEPSDNLHEDEKEEAAETRSVGQAAAPQLEDEVPEPSSPPCYLHEFPTLQSGDTPSGRKPASEPAPREHTEPLREGDEGIRRRPPAAPEGLISS